MIIAGPGLPDDAKSLPPTFLAVHGIDEAREELEVTCVFYHGPLSISAYKKLRSQLTDYNMQPNYWLTLTIEEETGIGNRSEWRELLRQQVLGAKLDQQVEEGLKQFASDLRDHLSLPAIYFKILLGNLNKQIWHPWGLPSVRRQMLNVVKEIEGSDQVIEAFTKVDREWGIVQRLFGKALVADAKPIIERVVQRLDRVAELEAAAFRLLELELEVEK